MSDRLRRIVRDLTLFVMSLLLEFVTFALVVGGIAIIWYQPGYRLKNYSFSIELWLIGIIYRTFSLHLYGSWSLKRFLITRQFGAASVAFFDLMLAVLWAAALALFSVPAKKLFASAAFWAPIFLAIFFGSFLFSLFERRRLVSTP